MRIERQKLGAHLSPLGRKLAELCNRSGLKMEDVLAVLPEEDQRTELAEWAQSNPRVMKMIKDDSFQGDVVEILAEAWTAKYYERVPSALNYERPRIKRGVARELNEVFSEAA